jgi:hypothetical protein
MSDSKTTVPPDARIAAANWWRDHQAHVGRLIASREGEGSAYPPSGSDRFHPELWKASHWRWFDGIVILEGINDGQ